METRLVVEIEELGAYGSLKLHPLADIRTAISRTTLSASSEQKCFSDLEKRTRWCIGCAMFSRG